MYELDRWSKDLKTKFNLKDFLFGAVKLIKHDNPNKYFYSAYGIGFNSRSIFPIQNFDRGDNIIIFGADMGSSVHANNKSKNILILGKGQTK